MLSQSLPHTTNLLPKPNLPNRIQSFPQFRHPHHSTRPKTRLYAATHDPSILSPHLHDDFYSLLGIPPTCGCGEVKRAYRDLARRLHPDVSPPGRAREFTEKFVQVQRAYETLSDPERRAVYDRDVARGLRRALAGRGGDEEELMRNDWMTRVQAQLEGLKQKNMDHISGHNMSWAAQMRRSRATQTRVD